MARVLKNVDVLGVDSSPKTVVIEFHAKEQPKGYSFFVEINKKDPKSFQKLSCLLKRLTKNNYKMDLNIKSFSAKPSGSRYHNNRAHFICGKKKKAKK